MKKIVYPLLLLLVLEACSKHANQSVTPQTGSYAGKFQIKTTVNGNTLFSHHTETPSFKPEFGDYSEAWIITKSASDQYTISPTTGSNLDADFYNVGYIALMPASHPPVIQTLFTFEPIQGGSKVNIKSAADNKYAVLLYGLDAGGKVIYSSLEVANKSDPCSPTFVGPTASTGCQFDFEMVKY